MAGRISLEQLSSAAPVVSYVTPASYTVQFEKQISQGVNLLNQAQRTSSPASTDALVVPNNFQMISQFRFDAGPLERLQGVFVHRPTSQENGNPLFKASLDGTPFDIVYANSSYPEICGETKPVACLGQVQQSSTVAGGVTYTSKSPRVLLSTEYANLQAAASTMLFFVYGLSLYFERQGSTLGVRYLRQSFVHFDILCSSVSQIESTKQNFQRYGVSALNDVQVRAPGSIPQTQTYVRGYARAIDFVAATSASLNVRVENTVYLFIRDNVNLTNDPSTEKVIIDYVKAKLDAEDDRQSVVSLQDLPTETEVLRERASTRRSEASSVVSEEAIQEQQQAMQELTDGVKALRISLRVNTPAVNNVVQTLNTAAAAVAENNQAAKSNAAAVAAVAAASDVPSLAPSLANEENRAAAQSNSILADASALLAGIAAADQDRAANAAVAAAEASPTPSNVAAAAANNSAAEAVATVAAAVNDASEILEEAQEEVASKTKPDVEEQQRKQYATAKRALDEILTVMKPPEGLLSILKQFIKDNFVFSARPESEKEFEQYLTTMLSLALNLVTVNKDKRQQNISAGGLLNSASVEFEDLGLLAIAVSENLPKLESIRSALGNPAPWYNYPIDNYPKTLDEKLQFERTIRRTLVNSIESSIKGKRNISYEEAFVTNVERELREPPNVYSHSTINLANLKQVLDFNSLSPGERGRKVQESLTEYNRSLELKPRRGQLPLNLGLPSDWFENLTATGLAAGLFAEKNFDELSNALAWDISDEQQKIDFVNIQKLRGKNVVAVQAALSPVVRSILDAADRLNVLSNEEFSPFGKRYDTIRNRFVDIIVQFTPELNRDLLNKKDDFTAEYKFPLSQLAAMIVEISDAVESNEELKNALKQFIKTKNNNGLLNWLKTNPIKVAVGTTVLLSLVYFVATLGVGGVAAGVVGGVSTGVSAVSSYYNNKKAEYFGTAAFPGSSDGSGGDTASIPTEGQEVVNQSLADPSNVEKKAAADAAQLSDLRVAEDVAEETQALFEDFTKFKKGEGASERLTNLFGGDPKRLPEEQQNALLRTALKSTVNPLGAKLREREQVTAELQSQASFRAAEEAQRAEAERLYGPEQAESLRKAALYAPSSEAFAGVNQLFRQRLAAGQQNTPPAPSGPPEATAATAENLFSSARSSRRKSRRQIYGMARGSDSGMSAEEILLAQIDELLRPPTSLREVTVNNIVQLPAAAPKVLSRASSSSAGSVAPRTSLSRASSSGADVISSSAVAGTGRTHSHQSHQAPQGTRIIGTLKVHERVFL